MDAGASDSGSPFFFHGFVSNARGKDPLVGVSGGFFCHLCGRQCVCFAVDCRLFGVVIRSWIPEPELGWNGRLVVRLVSSRLSGSAVQVVW